MVAESRAIHEEDLAVEIMTGGVHHNLTFAEKAARGAQVNRSVRKAEIGGVSRGRYFDPVVDAFGFSRVSYGHDALSAKALQARMRASGPNRNLAVFEHLDGQGNRVISEVFENVPGDLHSEVVGITHLAERGVTPDRITKIFTELAPCGGGSHDCRALMQSLPNAEVSYAFETVAEKQRFLGAR